MLISDAVLSTLLFRVSRIRRSTCSLAWTHVTVDGNLERVSHTFVHPHMYSYRPDENPFCSIFHKPSRSLTIKLGSQIILVLFGILSKEQPYCTCHSRLLITIQEKNQVCKNGGKFILPTPTIFCSELPTYLLYSYAIFSFTFNFPSYILFP
jgi:hypothetical protein